MAIVLHVLKRLVLVVLGYLVGLLAALLGIVALYAVVSSLPNAPPTSEWGFATGIVVLLAPPLAFLAYMVAAVAAALPMLAAVVLTELFALRHIALHLVVGALVALAGLVALLPSAFDANVAPLQLLDLGIAALAGVLGGLVYWAIAGRRAGLKPRATAPSAVTQPVL